MAGDYKFLQPNADTQEQTDNTAKVTKKEREIKVCKQCVFVENKEL